MCGQHMPRGPGALSFICVSFSTDPKLRLDPICVNVEPFTWLCWMVHILKIITEKYCEGLKCKGLNFFVFLFFLFGF